MNFLKTFSILTISYFINICCFAQKPTNLNFEIFSKENNLPENWTLQQGAYDFFTDNQHAVEGFHSLSIKANSEGNNYAVVSYNFPNGYRGETLILEGYVKTKDVKNGYALFELELKKGTEVVSYNNMQDKKITGTTEWQKYKIEVPLIESDSIYINAYLVGEGQAWFDDFTVSIDGIKIQDLTFKKNEPYKAELDHEFDNGSNFKIKELNRQTIHNIAALSKAWGRLKYTNPKVAKGEYNWDYELLRILPIIEKKDFESELFKWIHNYGEPKNTIPKVHYYLRFSPYVGNPIFLNEKKYEEMDYTDDGYLLLALFRYWNMIEYFFPYKHLIKKEWNQVLEEYISKSLEVNDAISYKLNLLQLIGEIEDTHANIWQKDTDLDYFFGTKTAPIRIRFIENKAIVTDLFNELSKDSNVKIGDELIAINGVQTASIVEDKKLYSPASNEVTKLRDIAKKLLRTNHNQLNLKFSNEKNTYYESIGTVELDKIDFYKTDIPSHRELNGDIGYIYPASLEKDEIETIMWKFLDKKGIILDLRCYPSDPIMYSMGKFLMPEPMPFAKFKKHNESELEGFNITPAVEVGYQIPNYFKGRLAIIVNEETQSQAEFTTMALQIAPQAKVFGSQTAGADGNVSFIHLPGNIRTMISGIGVYYPDDTETQQVGIKIDEQISPTIQSIREGKDIVLEKAVEYLSN